MTAANEFPPCSARRRIVQWASDGTKTPIQRCGESTADMMGKTVTAAICEACPVRAEVTKAAMSRQEYQPPLIAEVTKSIESVKPDDGSDSRYLPCLDRNIVTIGSCCGQYRPIRVCDSVDCFRLGSEVNAGMCKACPARREE